MVNYVQESAYILNIQVIKQWVKKQGSVHRMGVHCTVLTNCSEEILLHLLDFDRLLFDAFMIQYFKYKIMQYLHGVLVQIFLGICCMEKKPNLR